MKNKFLLILVIGLILPFSPSLTTSRTNIDSDIVADTLIVSEQLAISLDSDQRTNTLLPTQVPFWTDLVNADTSENTGEGVYVAVLDTGLLPQWPFFFSDANIAWDLGKGFTHDITFENGGLAIGELRDDRGFITDLASGHGTHVTSTVVGFNINNNVWIEGIAPKATIIPVLVLDAWEVDSPFGPLRLSGGTDEMIAAGIMYIANLADSLDGPVVINMSLGGGAPQPLIEQAIDFAISKGVIVVAAAGNSGTDGMGWPGAFPQVISVAAVGWTENWIVNGAFSSGFWTQDVTEKLDKKDVFGNKESLYITDFSSRPNPALGQDEDDLDISAPGAAIVGPYKSAFANNVNYFFLWGTSMASPHVAATAALILEEDSDLDQSDIEHLLRDETFEIEQESAFTFDVFSFTFVTESWDEHAQGEGFILVDKLLDEIDDDDDEDDEDDDD